MHRPARRRADRLWLRKKAREDRNYALSDRIRDDLKKLGVQLMDGKDGEMTYSIE